MGYFAEQASCIGKQRFQSAKLAHAVVKRGDKRGKRRQAYRCEYCGFYHLGRSVKRRRIEEIEE